MNATALPAAPVRHPTTARPSRPAADAETKRRKRAIALGVCGAFLGAYVLGVTWFANTLTEDMARSFQLAPAVQDVEHR